MMKKKNGFTLVEIMVVVSIVALLAAISIPNLLNARRTANESAAKATLQVISTAIETYSVTTNGQYAPADGTTSDSYLTGATPPYISKSYCGKTNEGGYDYACTMNLDGYTITAQASRCGTSGTEDYTITTGGVLAKAPCT